MVITTKEKSLNVTNALRDSGEMRLLDFVKMLKLKMKTSVLVTKLLFLESVLILNLVL